MKEKNQSRRVKKQTICLNALNIVKDDIFA